MELPNALAITQHLLGKKTGKSIFKDNITDLKSTLSKKKKRLCWTFLAQLLIQNGLPNHGADV